LEVLFRLCRALHVPAAKLIARVEADHEGR
jgi:hypothetical protein